MAANEAITKIKINVDSSEAIRSLRGFKNAVTGAISGVAVKQIYDFTKALAIAGAEGLQAEKIFKKFVPNVADATKKMQSATLGMIEDTKLQQQATQALISGIKFDDYTTALEYASKFAISTGKDTEEVMSGILQGFLTGRGISLKRAGIVVNSGKNMVKDAVDQMKTKMKELDVSSDDPIVKMKMLQTEIENLKDQVGREAIPIFNAWNEGFLALAKNAGEMAKKTASFIEYIASVNSSNGDIFLANNRMKIKSAKELEDSTKGEIALNEMLLKQQDNKRILTERLTALKSFPNKETQKETETYLKRTLAIIQEIEGALYIVKNRKPTTPFKPTSIVDEDAAEKRLKEKQKEFDLERKMVADADEFLRDEQKDFLQRKQDAAQEDFDKTRQMQFDADEYLRKEKIDFSERKLEKDKKDKEDLLRQEEDFYNNATSLASNFNSVLLAFSNRATNKELENLDRKKLGEKRYNKEKEKILKEQEEQERTFARVQQGIILGQTFMNIAKGQAVATSKGFFGLPEWFFVAAQGALEIASIQAQHFQRGYLGEVNRGRTSDNINAQIGRNEAVIPGPQYAMHSDEVRAIVNNTANTAAGMRSLKGGGVVNNFYGLSSEQVIAVQRESERRKYTGRLI